MVHLERWRCKTCGLLSSYCLKNDLFPCLHWSPDTDEEQVLRDKSTGGQSIRWGKLLSLRLIIAEETYLVRPEIIRCNSIYNEVLARKVFVFSSCSTIYLHYRNENAYNRIVYLYNCDASDVFKVNYHYLLGIYESFGTQR